MSTQNAFIRRLMPLAIVEAVGLGVFAVLYIVTGSSLWLMALVGWAIGFGAVLMFKVMKDAPRRAQDADD